jgi:hypothetical protein
MLDTTKRRRSAAARPKAAPAPAPAAPKKVRKDEGHTIYVRCDDAEHERYMAKFAESGLRNYSDWVRMALNSYCARAQ